MEESSQKLVSDWTGARHGGTFLRVGPGGVSGWKRMREATQQLDLAAVCGGGYERDAVWNPRLAFGRRNWKGRGFAEISRSPVNLPLRPNHVHRSHASRNLISHAQQFS